MAELQADFELLPRETLEANMELVPRDEIEATFEINIATKGDPGIPGKDAKINGVNTLTLTTSYGLTLTQSGSNANISGKEITDVVDGISALIPAQASEQNQLADKQYVLNSLPTIEDLTTTAQQNALNSGITSAKVTQITTNKNNIASEITNRQNADNNLQQQIDAISASSDVKDIVGTYAQLQAYDTSTLGNNDIIKVLQDETQNNETTYYRWNSTTQTFTLIGEEGPYYTKSEANSTFVPQTRTVNGKALSANITLSASDVGALPDSTVIPTKTSQLTNDSNFVDETALENGLSKKIDKDYAVNDFATNCITNIPQDIKLELSSGTLTLKSGSVITNPDGTQRQTTADQTRISPGGTDSYTGVVVCAASNGAIQSIQKIEKLGSGSSLPADNTTYSVYYNTTDGKIYHWTSGAWSEFPITLPLAIVTVTSGTITSIDKVFNGFGYIGSTMFVLPDVEALHSNGFNDDGTLKNDVVHVSSLIFHTRDSGNTSDRKLILNKSGSSCQITLADPSSWVYSKEENKYIYLVNGDTNWVDVGSCTLNLNQDNKIMSFETRPVSGLSHRYIEQALGYTPENIGNKVTSISSSSTDTQYPSAKCVYDAIPTQPSDIGAQPAGSYVTTNTQQTISRVKYFSSGAAFGTPNDVTYKGFFGEEQDFYIRAYDVAGGSTNGTSIWMYADDSEAELDLDVDGGNLYIQNNSTTNGKAYYKTPTEDTTASTEIDTVGARNTKIQNYVKDATLTITQNGTTVGTFSANASSNVTVNLTDTKTTMTYTALTETLTWS